MKDLLARYPALEVCKEDILKEWSDLRDGLISKDEFLKKYDFDYVFARGESGPLYNLDGGFEMIYEEENTSTRIYKKVDKKI